MFGKAKVKRFNEEVSNVPAPNAYDAQTKETKGGVAVVKSQRFEDSKYVTPGPGQYQLSNGLGLRPSGFSQAKLTHSSSFRIKKTSLADLTSTSAKGDLSQGPVSSTPRKLRRSLSSNNISESKISTQVSQSKDSLTTPEQELEALKRKNHDLERQMFQLRAKMFRNKDKPSSEECVMTKIDHMQDFEQIRKKLEAKDTELEVCRTELRYQTQLCEEAQEEMEKLAAKCEQLSLKGDRAESLKYEVDLLTQDNCTLEEEIDTLREDRKKFEMELEEMATRRSELEAKCQEEDAKNIFLHFTQEQLNSQVVSLECVMNSLKQENHLLSRGINKLVANLQEEKMKTKEITDAYMKENADSEEEFKNLQNELDKARGEYETASNSEVRLRIQLGEAQVIKQQLEEKIAEIDEKLSLTLRELDSALYHKERLQVDLTEALKEFEVSENDKTVLRDTLKTTEEEKNGLALDLGEITKSKLVLEEKLKERENEIEALNHDMDDVRGEVHEVEMTKVGLEGVLASLREEISQTEVSLCEKSEELQRSQCQLKSLQERLSEQESLMADNKMLWSKDLEKLRCENSSLEEIAAKKDTEISTLKAETEELKVNREEIEESLLDTQELVACMETKLDDAYKLHKEEAEALCGQVKTLQEAEQQLKVERSKLIDINTDLSSQVSESLHAIANLQDTENLLGTRSKELQVRLEIAEEDAERSRVRLQQAEEEISNLQVELESSLAEIGEMEAKRIEDRCEYNQVVEQLEETKTDYNQISMDLKEAKTVGRELYLRVQDLESQAEQQLQETNSWKQQSYDSQSEVQLLRDNVAHLEVLRNNLELNVSDKTDLVGSLREELKTVEEKCIKDKEAHEDTIKANLRLKGNLEAHKDELRTLRQQQERGSAQLDALSLRADKAEADAAEGRAAKDELVQQIASMKHRLSEMEAEKENKETIRMKEMEMLIELRTVIEQQQEKIEQLEMAVEKAESAERSMEAQQRLLCEAEDRAAMAEEALEKWSQRMSDAEMIMKEMEAKIEEEEEKNKVLQGIIEPFKDQLESFELEKNALLSQSEHAQGEVKKLAAQYGQLLGHHNQKQKIQHVVKIKQENVDLKSEIVTLREQLTKYKKNISKLEEKLNEAMGIKRFDHRLSFQTPTLKNKENSFVQNSSIRDSATTFSTPMGPPARDINKSRNHRISTSSPLRDKN